MFPSFKAWLQESRVLLFICRRRLLPQLCICGEAVNVCQQGQIKGWGRPAMNSTVQYGTVQEDI